MPGRSPQALGQPLRVVQKPAFFRRRPKGLGALSLCSLAEAQCSWASGLAFEFTAPSWRRRPTGGRWGRRLLASHNTWHGGGVTTTGVKMGGGKRLLPNSVACGKTAGEGAGRHRAPPAGEGTVPSGWGEYVGAASGRRFIGGGKREGGKRGLPIAIQDRQGERGRGRDNGERRGQQGGSKQGGPARPIHVAYLQVPGSCWSRVGVQGACLAGRAGQRVGVRLC